MTTNSPQTTVVYPSVHPHSQEDAYLQPILVSIYFAGSFPRNLAVKPVPIQISVTLSEEFKCFTTPVIGEIVEDSLVSGSQTDSDDVSEITQADIPIPFLPLPADFNSTDCKQWALLCSDIQRWLLSVPENSQHWAWGCDIFWLSFVAAHPEFPSGRWFPWNPKITPSGSFIEGWLDGSLKRLILGVDAGDGALHAWIWDEFTRQALLFFPAPIISSDT